MANYYEAVMLMTETELVHGHHATRAEQMTCVVFLSKGLTLLVPYLMTTKKMWKNCKLRVFMAGTKKDAFNKDHRQ